ncbi:MULTISPECIES: hypothetical protein [unclassified Enterococcus]|uniref:hypothetical protein n=1 Tax=unclassified Enterococcus TaxID=2608891 RepID=UPI003F204D60
MSEKLYRVILPIKFSDFKYDYLDMYGRHCKSNFLALVPKLTERQIRRIDPKLMALAVEAEG